MGQGGACVGGGGGGGGRGVEKLSIYNMLPPTTSRGD